MTQRTKAIGWGWNFCLIETLDWTLVNPYQRDSNQSWVGPNITPYGKWMDGYHDARKGCSGRTLLKDVESASLKCYRARDAERLAQKRDLSGDAAGKFYARLVDTKKDVEILVARMDVPGYHNKIGLPHRQEIKDLLGVLTALVSNYNKERAAALDLEKYSKLLDEVDEINEHAVHKYFD